jgi:hypothetical protein
MNADSNTNQNTSIEQAYINQAAFSSMLKVCVKSCLSIDNNSLSTNERDCFKDCENAYNELAKIFNNPQI